MSMNRLSPQFKFQNMSLFNDGLKVSFQGIPSQEETLSPGLIRLIFSTKASKVRTASMVQAISMVRAEIPFLLDQHMCYFETHVIETQTSDYDDDMMPGWGLDSWGYHGDDGKLYCSSLFGKSRSWAETFGKGDVVGCGIGRRAGGISFTKNGKYLGVGGRDVNCSIAVNFGASPFHFNLHEQIPRQSTDAE
ncbi:hypothetical protein K440DRAFT_684845 [Wilcoxina mikolae CBS 423.85]|nr:hypothetical protein K440DRAFT_684845 [Wilcoxina mikolae CBS 423.85]